MENLTNIANNRIDKLWNVVLEIIKKQNSDYITLKHYEGVIKNHLPSATPRTTKFYSGIVHATEAKFGSLLSLERYGNWSMFEDGNEIILFGNMKFKHFSVSACCKRALSTFNNCSVKLLAGYPLQYRS